MSKRFETRRVANDYTIRFRGQFYQIDRKTIVQGLRGGKVRLESRLDSSLAVRCGNHDLALRRGHTWPRSEDAKQQAASAPAEKAPRQAPHRRGSKWRDNFDLKKSPPLWQAAQACGARRGDAPAGTLS